MRCRNHYSLIRPVRVLGPHYCFYQISPLIFQGQQTKTDVVSLYSEVPLSLLISAPANGCPGETLDILGMTLLVIVQHAGEQLTATSADSGISNTPSDRSLSWQAGRVRLIESIKQSWTFHRKCCWQLSAEIRLFTQPGLSRPGSVLPYTKCLRSASITASSFLDYGRRAQGLLGQEKARQFAAYLHDLF